jgi:phosphatidate cytidylyltransferase
MALGTFPKKAFTGAVGFPALFFLNYYSAPGFLVILAAAAALGWNEYRGLLRARSIPAPLLVPIAFLAALIYSTYRDAYQPIEFRWVLYGLGVYLAVWSVAVVKDVQVALPALGATLLGMIGMAAPLASLAVIAQGTPAINGAKAVLWLLIVVWMGDGCAYLIGFHFGRHKLAPTISPRKSWEGAIANVLGAGALAVLLRMIFLAAIPILDVLLLGLVLGALAIVGDLLESQWKRYADLKDSAKLLPGHGGILDRVDSLVLCGPCFLLYLQDLHVR